MAIVAALSTSGCASRPARDPGSIAANVCRPPATVEPAVRGTRADVHAQRGAHEGFAVEDDCRDPTCFGVRGTGARYFPGLRPWDRPLPREIAEAWRSVVVRALAGIASVHSSAFGGACNAPGLLVWLDDWRDVDLALERLGAMLRADDLKETIGVCVMERMRPIELARRYREE
jgi:hypothetical protein